MTTDTAPTGCLRHIFRWMLGEMDRYGGASIVEGAGQNRPFGRLGFFHHFAAIRDALRNRIKKITDEAVLPHRVREWLPRDAEVDSGRLDVVVIYSLAGGTGAGMFLDVGMLARHVVQRDLALRLQPRFTHYAVLPEAYVHRVPLDDDMRAKIQETGFTCLREMEYFSMKRSAATGSPSDQAFDLSIPPPVPPEDAERPGPEPLYRVQWERNGEEYEIRDAPWNTCYLVGAGNDPMSAAFLSPGEVTQMIAERLFLDFDPSQFGATRRPLDSNLTQGLLSRMPIVVPNDQGDELYRYFVSRRFSIFGLSQIFFDRTRMRRAASFRLAEMLVERWLRPSGLMPAVVQQVAQQDLLGAAGARRVVTETQEEKDPLLAMGYDALRDHVLLEDREHDAQRSYWTKLQAQVAELRRAVEDGQVDPRSDAALVKLQREHEPHLEKPPAGEPGVALRTFRRNREALVHEVDQRLRCLFVYRLRQHGIQGAGQLFAEYNALVQKELQRAQANLKAPPVLGSEWGERLRDACKVPWPCTRPAARIELLRALTQVHRHVAQCYHYRAIPDIRACLERAQRGVSLREEQEGSYSNLLRRLHAALDSPNERSTGVRQILHVSFDQLSKPDTGQSRTIGLLARWEDQEKQRHYDDHITKLLAADGSEPAIDWPDVERKVLAALRASGKERWADVKHLGDLALTLVRLDSTDPVSPVAVEEFARDLAEACEGLLKGFARDTSALMRFDQEPDPRNKETYLDTLRLYSASFLRKSDADDDRPHDLTVGLVPAGWRLEDVSLPDAGLEGEVRFAWGARDEPRPALLLPRLSGRIGCRCADRTNRPVDGALQVYQRGKSVTLSMELRTEVPAWLKEVSGGGADARPDVTVKSDGIPCALRPGAPHRFALQLDTSRWTPRQQVGFVVTLHLHTVPPVRFDGKVALVEGEELSFGQSDVWEGEVPLGRVCYPSFLLTASEATLAPGITLADHRILYEGGAEGWLRVLAPDDWPCVVPPRGAGDPVALRLEVDTTGLDRRRFDASLQQACVELRDTRHRPWTCEVRLTLNRPERLRQFLAVDWGTTNSCASYRGSDQDGPRAVRIHPDQQTPEQFPSDVYFKDLSDPDNPVFYVGFQARQLAQAHPECCLHSLKRKFQFQDEVFVMDEHRRPYRYKVAQVVTLVLLKLVTMAEETLGREVVKLGLTFPTKWLPRVRHRLEAVAEDVRRRLQARRTGETVVVPRPEVDEANAVALQVLNSRRPAPLPQSFHLVAYDFGGGTVDTALLHVEFAPATRRLSTRYVGIGGRSDLGGDDVTRAVLLLLHQRLPLALPRSALFLDAERTQAVQLVDVPLVRDGTPPSADTDEDTYRKGRKNWDVFWKAAEGIKIDLCTPQMPVAAVPLGEEPHLAEDDRATASLPPSGDPQRALVAQRLAQFYQDISCRVEADGVKQLVPLDRIMPHLLPEEQDQFRQGLGFTLEDVYRFELPAADGSFGGQPYRLSQRVEDTVKELRWQCDERKVEPYLIVLAGGGCGLPLVSGLFRKYFPGRAGQPGPLIEYDHAFSKQRVAHGMASFLFLRQFARLDDLARSVDVLHHALGLLQLDWGHGLQPTFQAVAPVGTRINDPAAWHRFAFELPEGEPHLPLFLQDWREGPQPFGHVDFGRTTAALPGDAACEAGPLPAAAAYDGELRLRGAECLEVCVTVGGKRYGPFPVVATVSDPEAALQG